MSAQATALVSMVHVLASLVTGVKAIVTTNALAVEATHAMATALAMQLVSATATTAAQVLPAKSNVKVVEEILVLEKELAMPGMDRARATPMPASASSPAPAAASAPRATAVVTVRSHATRTILFR